MIEWLSLNWLAFYGAVVGTLALILNFLRLRHQIKSGEPKLSISVAKHSSYDENIARLQAPEEETPPFRSSRPSMVEIYEITVRNLGSVEAHIESCGVVTANGEKKEASVRAAGQREFRMMQKTSSNATLSVSAKSSETFSVYLHRDEDLFEVSHAFAV